jgi:hypothetical protein
MNVSFPQHQAVMQQRFGGVSLEDYAEVLAKRERLYDEGKIAKGWFGIKGDKAYVLDTLMLTCQRTHVPFHEGDLERSGRSPEWDAKIASDPAVRAAFRDVYAAALVFMNNLPTLGPEYQQHHARFAQNDEIIFNPFLPIAKRKQGISTAAKVAGEQKLIASVRGELARPPGSGGPDPVIFPGEKLSKISDFVRIQRAMQNGDFPGILTREGIDPGYYGQMSIRLVQAIQSDTNLQAQYTLQLQRSA